MASLFSFQGATNASFEATLISYQPRPFPSTGKFWQPTLLCGSNGYITTSSALYQGEMAGLMVVALFRALP